MKKPALVAGFFILKFKKTKLIAYFPTDFLKNKYLSLPSLHILQRNFAVQLSLFSLR